MVTNRKAPERRGKVQLLDAGEEDRYLAQQAVVLCRHDALAATRASPACVAASLGQVPCGLVMAKPN